MGLETDTIKRNNSELVLSKLNALCINVGKLSDKMEKNVSVLSDKIDENGKEHREIFKEIGSLKISAKDDHPNCKTGVVNSTKIKTVEDKITLRDKIGVSALIALVISAIKTWWPS